MPSPAKDPLDAFLDRIDSIQSNILPTFYGSSEEMLAEGDYPGDWLYYFLDHCITHRVQGANRILLFESLLEGNAMVWFQSLPDVQRANFATLCLRFCMLYSPAFLEELLVVIDFL